MLFIQALHSLFYQLHYFITGQVQDPDSGECIDCETGCKTCSAGKSDSFTY